MLSNVIEIPENVIEKLGNETIAALPQKIDKVTQHLLQRLCGDDVCKLFLSFTHEADWMASSTKNASHREHIQSSDVSDRRKL